MDFLLTSKNPADALAMAMAKSELKLIRKRWQSRISLITVVKLTAFIIRVLQLIIIARILSMLALKKTFINVDLLFSGLAVTAVLNVLLAYFSDRLAAFLSVNITDHFRKSMLAQLEQGLLNETLPDNIGATILLFNNQAAAIAPYFTRYLPQQALAVSTPLLILAYISTISWICGAIIFFTIPMIPVYMMLIGKGTEKASKDEWKQLSLMSGYFYDRIKGITTLYIFGREKIETGKVLEASENYRESAMKVLKIAFLSSAAIEFFSTIIIAGVSIIVGLNLIGYISLPASETFTLFSGLILLMILPEFFSAIKTFGLYYHDRTTALGSMMSFQEAGLFADHGAKSDHAVQRNEERAPAQINAGEASTPSIQFRNVTYQYPSGISLFNGLSLIVNKGDKIWIKGANGSGKSTLVDLLNGFRKVQSGDILIDGSDATFLSQERKSAIFGWAGQHSRIFKGTLRLNLSFGSALDDRAIKQMINHYFDWDIFIAPYENGLDTLIEEDGKSISGGERHKISLARVILKDSPVWLLDEPFTHLDKPSIFRFIQGLSTTGLCKTILLITHEETDLPLNNFKIIHLNER